MTTYYESTTPDGKIVEGIDVVKMPGLEIPNHDYIGLTYAGTLIQTVVYKVGGASGTTVCTLTLAYDGSNNLSSVTKS